MKHPEVITWEKWLESAEGAEAAKASTLPANSTGDYYLKNRLWRAFQAGIDAGKNSAKVANG